MVCCSGTLCCRGGCHTALLHCMAICVLHCRHSRPITQFLAEGMNGLLAAPAGEACPAVLPSPFSGLGDDITSNSVVCAVFKLPPHHPHDVHLLPGAQEEVRACGLRGREGGGAVGCLSCCRV